MKIEGIEPVNGVPAAAILAAAIACHEANRAYCHSIGDESQTSWEDAPQWQRESAVKGIVFLIENPTSGPEQSHESWMREKQATGWKYGPVKDADKKEHPCYVPYNELPVDQRQKDYIFQSVARAMLSSHGVFDAGAAFIYSHDTTRTQAVKQLRKELDQTLGRVQFVGSRGAQDKQGSSREMSLAITKIEEGMMWLGKELGRLREPYPYPQSRVPENEKIEPTADGLKNH